MLRTQKNAGRFEGLKWIMRMFAKSKKMPESLRESLILRAQKNVSKLYSKHDVSDKFRKTSHDKQMSHRFGSDWIQWNGYCVKKQRRFCTKFDLSKCEEADKNCCGDGQGGGGRFCGVDG